MEKAEWEKRLRIRQEESESIEGSQFPTSQEPHGISAQHLTMWRLVLSKGQPGLLACTYFRRELCYPGRANVQQWPRAQVASHYEAQGTEFLCLFVQKLGDIEGQDPHILLLNSLKLGYFLDWPHFFIALTACNPPLVSTEAILWLISRVPFSRPSHSLLSMVFLSLLHSLWLFSNVSNCRVLY